MLYLKAEEHPLYGQSCVITFRTFIIVHNRIQISGEHSRDTCDELYLNAAELLTVGGLYGRSGQYKVIVARRKAATRTRLTRMLADRLRLTVSRITTRMNARCVLALAHCGENGNENRLDVLDEICCENIKDFRSFLSSKIFVPGLRPTYKSD